MRKHQLLAILQQITGFSSLSLFRKKNEKDEIGEIKVHRFSTGETLSLPQFCKEHHIVLSAEDLAISDKDDIIHLKDCNYHSVKGVNIFKKNILYCYDLLHKHQTGWKAKRYQSLIANFAKKCQIPFEVAEKRIRPSTAHTYMNHQTVYFFKKTYGAFSRNFNIFTARKRKESDVFTSDSSVLIFLDKFVSKYHSKTVVECQVFINRTLANPLPI